MRKTAHYLWMALLYLGFIGIHAWADNIPADSKIFSVMVYPGAARVTRSAKVELAPGAHTIEFSNIIPQIDENSLTVAGQGNAEAQMRIFGAKLKTEYLKETADQRIKELERKIEAVGDKLKDENANLDILNQEKEFLNSVKLFSGQQIPKDLVTTMPSASNLQDTLNFLATQLTGIRQKEVEINIRIRELNKELTVLNQELGQLRSSFSNLKRSVLVDLDCQRAGTFSVDVSYLVYGAQWFSVYDARTKYAAGEVELTSFGVVKQTTGEDWIDVALTLSTVQPMLGGRMPEVTPWFLQIYQPEAVGLKMGRFIEAIDASGEMMPANQEATFFDRKLENFNAPSEQPVAAAMAYAKAVQSGISVVYRIERPATIKSDGTESKLPITSQTLKADFEYSTFPRASTFAYLGSQVKNGPDLQLLAGEVHLFLEGNYAGKSSIDNIGPGQDFDLYLGVDENIKVKREEVFKKVDDVLIGGIPSSTKKTTYKYKLTVENYTGQKTRVKLFEAVPISQNEKIKTKIFDVSLPPKTTDWKDRRGIWLWELDLEPSAKQEIFYTFFVEHPRDIQISGIY